MLIAALVPLMWIFGLAVPFSPSSAPLPLLFCLSFGNCGLVFDPPVSSTVTEEIYEMMRDIFAVSVFQ